MTKRFSHLAGIRFVERLGFRVFWRGRMTSFSPLAGIRFVESFLGVGFSLLHLPSSFSPLAGIRFVESY